MKTLFAAVTEAREAGTGRRLCDLFMVKPSKKDYPDYYKVILEPMDLRTIEQTIRSERYNTEEALMDDMKLMFRNARHYNEEGSQVRGALGLTYDHDRIPNSSRVIVILFLTLWSPVVFSYRYTTMLTFWKRFWKTDARNWDPHLRKMMSDLQKWN